MPPLRAARTPYGSDPDPDPDPRSRCIAIDDFGPLVDVARHGRRSQRALRRLASAGLCAARARNQIGSLARSCIAAAAIGLAEASSAPVREIATRLVRQEEIDQRRCGCALVVAAVSRTQRSARATMCVRSSVREEAHEVPFTMSSRRFLRGTGDCLVQTASDRFTVLEFKTGRERSEHHAQIDLYQRAMQQVFPDCKVDARLIYAGTPSAS